MLGVLIESKAARQRRAGGAALSVAAHLAIIGAVAATTVRGGTAKHEPEKPVVIHFARPVAPTPVMRTSSARSSTVAAPVIDVVSLPRIPVPTFVPTSLPPIDASRGFSLDSITAPAERGGGGGIARGLSFGPEASDDGGAWTGNELLMHVLSTARPRYPETLRQAGVDGRVLVRFTVDTTGRIDPASVEIVSSTHDLFSRAVKDALGGFRFKPAEVGGRRVRALAEMPFEFQVSR